MTSEVVDLDARRREAGLVAHTVLVSGVEFTLPAVITCEQGKALGVHLAEDDTTIAEAIAAALFGGRAVEALSLMNGDEMLELWTSFGGDGPGELEASSKPSKSTGGRSKRTSNASTD